MKSKIQLLLIVTFIGCSFYGCTKKDVMEDYITVDVKVKGVFYTKDNTTGGTFGGPNWLLNTPIRVDILKDGGGDSFTLYLNMGQLPSGSFYFGSEDLTLATFKLYREQDIEVIAYMEIVEGGYTQIRGIDLLTWDEVYPRFDFGEHPDWICEVSVVWLFN